MLATYIGISIIALACLETGILLAFDRLKPLALGFGFLCIFGGIAVANATGITEIVMSLSGGNALKVQRTVETKAAEIEDIEKRVQQTEKNISDTRDSIRHAVRALLATTYLTMGAFPFMWSGAAGTETRKNLDDLAVFAYPDPIEREKAKQRLMSLAGGPSAAPTSKAP